MSYRPPTPKLLFLAISVAIKHTPKTLNYALFPMSPVCDIMYTIILCKLHVRVMYYITQANSRSKFGEKTKSTRGKLPSEATLVDRKLTFMQTTCTGAEVEFQY